MINRINELLKYKDGDLYWKQSRGSVKAGSKAGCTDKDGYVLVRLDGILHKSHRLIWIMHNGDIDENMQIDHINGIENDNRIDNLRLVSNKENNKNKTVRKGNKSGVNGVTWIKRDNKWLAQIMVDGKNIYLLRTKSKEEAIEARLNAEVKYGFHKNNNRNKASI